MYSAADVAPRWPVPRPSRRSWERKRTWVSMLSGRMLSHRSDGGRGKVRTEAGFGRAVLLAFLAPALLALRLRQSGVERRRAWQYVRMFTQGPRSFTYRRLLPNCKRKQEYGRHHPNIILVYLAVFRLHLGSCPATAGSVSSSLNQRGNRERPPRAENRRSGVCGAAASLRWMSSTSCLTHPTLVISIWPSGQSKTKWGHWSGRRHSRPRSRSDRRASVRNVTPYSFRKAAVCAGCPAKYRRFVIFLSPCALCRRSR